MPQRLRALAGPPALLLSAATWALAAGGRFTPACLLCWLLSVAGWLLVLGRETEAGEEAPEPLPLVPWEAAALLAVLLTGAAYRFVLLDLYPAEMTSDHVEKLRDAFSIADLGERPVFLAGNGGREPLQFFLLAGLHEVAGIPLGFRLLKLLTASEGLAGIAGIWWLGRRIARGQGPATARLAGLFAAAFLAVSHWHTMLSRLGLRIVLTPLVVSVFLVFLDRALRQGRRGDFLKAGLVGGCGLYAYQALRIVPPSAAVALLVAAWARRRKPGAAREAAKNGAAFFIVLLAVSVPLARYAATNPAPFWSRTVGRLVGNESPAPLPGGRLAAIARKSSALGGNLVRAAGMFNIRGDASWISGTPGGAPGLDPVTGSLFLAGLLLALGRATFRDRGDTLWPAALVVFLLPTALAIARPGEVPSATRASGALPVACALAASAAATLVLQLRGRGPALRAAGLVAGLAALLWAARWNARTYFGTAMGAYRASTFPYQQAGELLRAFRLGRGAPGNAFMVAVDFGWDHRALGIEADDLLWPNGVLHDPFPGVVLEKIHENEGTAFSFRPDRPLLFFVQPGDSATLERLRTWLPAGRARLVHTHEPNRDFTVYIAPEGSLAGQLLR